MCGLGAYVGAALFVHCGVLPWLGDRRRHGARRGCRRLHRRALLPLQRRPASISRFSPSPSTSSPASCSIISTGSAARPDCFLPVAHSAARRSAASARLAHDVLLPAAGAFGWRALVLSRLLLRRRIGYYLARDPRGPGGGRALGIDVVPRQARGGDLVGGAHRGGRRRDGLLRQQSLSRHDLRHRRVRSRSYRRRSSAASAPCSARSSAPSC